MWNSLLLITVVLTAGLILLAYVGAELAYRHQETNRQHSGRQFAGHERRHVEDSDRRERTP